MSCEEIREQLVETARSRALSSDLRKIVFSHAAGCAPCEGHLENERRLTNALADLSLAGENAPARMEQAILTRLQLFPSRQPLRARKIWWGVAAGAAAAAGFLILGLSTETPRRPNPEPAKLTAPVTSVAREDAPPAPAHSPRRASGLVKPSSVSASNFSEDAGAFTPIPYAPELLLEEQAEMVRVRLPREALLSMGLSLAVQEAEEPVVADVLVGMDGTARAIRVAN